MVARYYLENDMKSVYGPIGSISHATLLMEDLLAASTSCLEGIKEKLQEQNDPETVKAVGEIDDLLGKVEVNQRESDYDGSEAQQYDYEEVTNLLEQYAPPYFYFGMNEGDGSDLGFWFCREAFDEAVSDGEILKIDDLGRLDVLLEHDELEEDVEYVAVVSDHGNVSLYSINRELKTYEEVFSIV